MGRPGLVGRDPEQNLGETRKGFAPGQNTQHEIEEHLLLARPAGTGQDLPERRLHLGFRQSLERAGCAGCRRKPQRLTPQARQERLLFFRRKLPNLPIESDANRVALEQFGARRSTMSRDPGRQPPELGDHAAVVPGHQGNEAPYRNAMPGLPTMSSLALDDARQIPARKELRDVTVNRLVSTVGYGLEQLRGNRPTSRVPVSTHTPAQIGVVGIFPARPNRATGGA